MNEQGLDAIYDKKAEVPLNEQGVLKNNDKGGSIKSGFTFQLQGGDAKGVVSLRSQRGDKAKYRKRNECLCLCVVIFMKC
jgi:hypothetical protein